MMILDMDQSGSMCDSITYSSVVGATFTSMLTPDTYTMAFDIQVTNPTELYRQDSMDVLFRVQLGRGTDVSKLVIRCQILIESPRKTMLILISGLRERGARAGFLRHLNETHEGGVKVIVLLALSDNGKPYYDEELGKKINELGIACFTRMSDRLSELVKSALKGNSLLPRRNDK